MLNAEASSSKPSTYSNQTRLPRLPIPELEKSLEAYVKSLVPLLEQKVSSRPLPQLSVLTEV